jgi:1-acyl-sn-glycerol-3-phosphate acyltransferase
LTHASQACTITRMQGAPGLILRSPARAVRDALVERIVRFAENRYGEDITARIGMVHTPKNEAGFDPFGFDPEAARVMLAVLAFFHRTYFRTEVDGIENVPQGRALFIANHSGQIPMDAMLIAAALMLDVNPPVLPRSMVEKWTQQLPFISVVFPRIGQVLGAPDNARRLLEADHALLVFPEGVRGISKPYAQRYQLEEFGLGFMRLALETNTPIVPVSVIGGEEQYPAIGNLKGLAKLLGMPVFPLLPQLMVGMALPLPTRYRITFGKPLRFAGDPDDDDNEMEARVREVRDAVHGMLETGLRKRKHVFW